MFSFKKRTCSLTFRSSTAVPQVLVRTYRYLIPGRWVSSWSNPEMYSSKENGVGSAWQTVFPFFGYAASDMSPFLYRPSANYTVVTLNKVQPKFELSIHVGQRHMEATYKGVQLKSNFQHTGTWSISAQTTSPRELSPSHVLRPCPSIPPSNYSSLFSVIWNLHNSKLPTSRSAFACERACFYWKHVIYISVTETPGRSLWKMVGWTGGSHTSSLPNFVLLFIQWSVNFSCIVVCGNTK